MNSYQQAVDTLYDLLLDKNEWPDALSTLTRVFSSEGCYLLMVDPTRSVVLGSAGYNLPTDAMHEYETETAAFCPRIAYANRVREFGVMYDYLHTPEGGMGRDPFYSWLMKSGLKYYLNIQAIKQPNMLGALAFQRTAAQGHVTDADIALAWKLVPHVRRVMQAQLLLGNAELRTNAAEHALNNLSAGVVFLDRSRDIMHMSQPAESILDADDGLGTIRGRLVASNANDDRAMQRVVQHTITSGSRAIDDETAATLPISRPSGKRSYQILVCPLSPEDQILSLLRPAAIVFIVDPERAPENAAQRLMRLYGLTEAEAAMAVDLLVGQSLADHAAGRQLTLNTARWRLKQLQAKTDTSSQMGLMRELMGGLAGTTGTPPSTLLDD